LGLTQGERGRRALEVVLGVTLGIAISDLLVLQLGTGWWQLGLVVAVSMSAALLLGSGQMFAQQAAVSAALVATLQPPD
ncbi:FUSC family protein, partial [Burkholderia multivorans]|uniref:FUSC family protein n=1 Tax=Burkholderia multivorans TaxID=87883 RepID=UPI0015EC1E4F